MNNEEYEHGELITDWNTVKPGSLIISKDKTFVTQFIACIDKDIIVRNTCENKNIYGEFPRVNFLHYYYAITKKKNVVKYLYEYVTKRNSIQQSNEYYVDDNDFKDGLSLISYSKFHRLDWTAKEFDE